MANGFNQRLQGLLANPTANLGIGLLAAGGPSAQPTSFGQGLAQASQFASERERQAMELQAAREQMMSRQRQRQALQKLPGLLSGGDEQAERTLGLLGEVAPEALAQTAFGQMFPQQQERAEPSAVRIARVLADPNEPQAVKDAVRQQIERSGQNEQVATMLKALELQMLQEQLSTEQEERERERIEGRISVLNADDALREVAQINERLKGTLGETGLGFDQVREAMAGPFAGLVGLFGGDTQSARQVAADMQRFEQLTTREGLQALFSGQVNAGTLTNSKVSTFLTTKPSLERLPETNSKIIADMLQENLDSAEVLGIELPDRSSTEQLIELLRESGPMPEPPSQDDSPPTFRNESEAERALSRGRINVGDIVIINGRRMRATE